LVITAVITGTIAANAEARKRYQQTERGCRRYQTTENAEQVAGGSRLHSGILPIFLSDVNSGMFNAGCTGA
jgi:hypothetical protein